MSTSEVFKPSSGPLILRGVIGTGAAEPMDSYKKKSSHGSRPATSGASSRFGSLSHHSFFARHNPHPGRVRHIKGLLDVPICSVNDDGFFSNPRYSAQFPPDSHNHSKLKTYRNYNIPAGAINVNTQKYPINTITGLQFFLGKPLNFRVFRDRPQPQHGISCPSSRQAPVDETWRDELKALTEALGLDQKGQKAAPASNKAVYSDTTGRLIPPPSRAMSRGMSRGGIPGSRMQTRDAMMTATLQSLGMEENSEDMVMNVLCQILQTEDVSSVQQWLVGAGDNEKSMVLDMIRAALDTNNEPAEVAQKQQLMDYEATQPPVLKEDDRDRVIGDDCVNEKIDRLSLDPPTPLPRPPSQQKGRCSPPNGAHRPFSQQNGRPNSKHSQNGFDNPIKMRYISTPQQHQQHQHRPIAEEDEERRAPSNLGGLPTVTFAGDNSQQAFGDGTLPPINN